MKTNPLICSNNSKSNSVYNELFIFNVIIRNIAAQAVTFLYPSIELSSSFWYDGFHIDASMPNSRVDSPLGNEHTS